MLLRTLATSEGLKGMQTGRFVAIKNKLSARLEAKLRDCYVPRDPDDQMVLDLQPVELRAKLERFKDSLGFYEGIVCSLQSKPDDARYDHFILHDAIQAALRAKSPVAEFAFEVCSTRSLDASVRVVLQQHEDVSILQATQAVVDHLDIFLTDRSTRFGVAIFNNIEFSDATTKTTYLESRQLMMVCLRVWPLCQRSSQAVQRHRY